MNTLVLLILIVAFIAWKRPNTPLGREIRKLVANMSQLFGNFGKGESRGGNPFGEDGENYGEETEGGSPGSSSRPPRDPERWKKMSRRGSRLVAVGVVLLAILALGYYSFYMVQPGNRGVIYRFGKIISVQDQGPHFKVPFIDQVTMIRAEEIFRLEFGYRTEDPGPPAKYRDNPEESKYLTSDNKIVEIDWVLQFQLAEPELFLTNFPGGAEGNKMLRDLSEAKMREIVASVALDDVLTVKKEEIQTRARMGIQTWLKELQTGIFVVAVQLQDVEPPKSVQASFSEVNSARAEKDRLELEAQKYENEILSSARGTAEKILNDSEAYAYRRVSLAQGEAARITSLRESYRRDPELVMNTLWLENMDSVWPELDVLVVDTGEGDSLNVLNLGDFLRILKTQQ
jgi:membrane protease subunit HflK